MANFDYRVNFKLPAFESFTCFGTRGIRKVQNRRDGHMYVNSRTNIHEEKEQILKYQKQYWKQSYRISKFYSENFGNYLKVSIIFNVAQLDEISYKYV